MEHSELLRHVVADLPARSIPALYDAFPAPELYLSEEGVAQAVAPCGSFNNALAPHLIGG